MRPAAALSVLLALSGARPAEGATAAVVEYYHLDAVGSVRALTNAAGQLVETHDLLPFGEEWCPGPPAGVCGSVAPGQPRRLTGKERDAESGLDYFGARYYVAALGRFTTADRVHAWQDSLADPQRWNRYAYAHNDPLRYVDPDGRYERDVHYELTRALARAAGFSATEAAAIAGSDQGVDDNPATAPMSITVDPGTGIRAQYHFTSQERRDQMWLDYQNTGSLEVLGQFLHVLQDSYSHVAFEPIVGHLFFGHLPDKTFVRPGWADVMADATYTALVRAAAARQGAAANPLDWESIEGFVKRFNRAWTDAGKAEAIADLSGYVERSQAMAEQ